MSMENAKEFLEKIAEDEALKERLAGKQPAEVLAAAKKLDLECTREELEAIAKSTQLSPDELSDVAGGVDIGSAISSAIERALCKPPCTNPEGHHWVYTHHDEEDNKLLGFIPCGTMGYNYYKCSFCHATKKVHVRQK